jgi:putative addiction module CopG family antidote
VEIAIDPQHRRYLNSKVHSGQFKSPSDVVKHALERLKEDERDAEWLKREFKRDWTLWTEAMSPTGIWKRRKRGLFVGSSEIKRARSDGLRTKVRSTSPGH